MTGRSVTWSEMSSHGGCAQPKQMFGFDRCGTSIFCPQHRQIASFILLAATSITRIRGPMGCSTHTLSCLNVAKSAVKERGEPMVTMTREIPPAGQPAF